MANTQANFEITKTEDEWQKILSPEQFEVLRKHGTERAGTSSLDREYRQGTFVCAACDLPLFISNAKGQIVRNRRKIDFC